MILDARTMPEAIWYCVYDAKLCRKRTDVVWVDDETNLYGVEVSPAHGVWIVVTHRSKKIAIYTDRKLVIINAIEDSEPDGAIEERKQRELKPA